MPETPSQKDLLNSVEKLTEQMGGQHPTARPYTFAVITVLLLVMVIGAMKFKNCPTSECIDIGKYILGFGLIVMFATMIYDLIRMKFERIEDKAQRALHNDVLSSVESAHAR